MEKKKSKRITGSTQKDDTGKPLQLQLQKNKTDSHAIYSTLAITPKVTEREVKIRSGQSIVQEVWPQKVATIYFRAPGASTQHGSKPIAERTGIIMSDRVNGAPDPARNSRNCFHIYLTRKSVHPQFLLKPQSIAKADEPQELIMTYKLLPFCRKLCDFSTLLLALPVLHPISRPSSHCSLFKDSLKPSLPSLPCPPLLPTSTSPSFMSLAGP